MPSVMWFRRDLRVHDHPALLAAIAAGDDGVVPLYVIDPLLWERSGLPRRSYLAASLRSLDEQLGGRLTVRVGNPAEEVRRVAREVEAPSVHISADYAPYGIARDARVAASLGDIPLEPLGSPYAVAPGRVFTQAGDRFKVFTPFFKAWQAHGWRAPAGSPDAEQTWIKLAGDDLPTPDPGVALPDVGEQAALDRWEEFRPRLESYPVERDRPDIDATSRLSAPLRWGEIHPRTLLADLSDSAADQKFRAELAWREFHAEVLNANPKATWTPLRPEYDLIETDTPGDALKAWKRGETGFPIVDAGLRELLATGLMHNRVRMIVASFLIKDLHLDWRLGAQHFMDHLIDGDVASNQLNWQWVAGSGTDAAPYFRVFNPTSQGRKFDPQGDYVRRWIPELSEAMDPHEPIGADGYPNPIVDHAHEREVALTRWQAIR